MKYSSQKTRLIRHRRVRAKIKGTEQRPRLAVFRSSQHIYAQIINDIQGKTLVAASDKELTKNHSNEKDTSSKKIALAKEVGKLIASKALKQNISLVALDRGGFSYHGRVKALAEGAREGGLKF